MLSSNNESKGISHKKEHREEQISKKYKERLDRMVLGKDENINDEYIQKFYLDVAKEVGKISLVKRKPNKTNLKSD